MNKTKVRFSAHASNKSDVVVLAMPHGKGMLESTDPRYNELTELVNENIASSPKYQGQAGQSVSFAAPTDTGYKRVVFLSLGEEQLKKKDFGALGNAVRQAVAATGYTKADILCDVGENSKVSEAEAMALMADAANAGSYSFDKYFTDGRQDTPALSLNFVTDGAKAAKAFYAPLAEITEGEFLAANMANEPGNVMYPESAAKVIEKELGSLPGVKVKVIDAKEMKKEKMRAALAVGQGSSNPPCMVVIEYDGTGGNTKDWPLALVGKGVTFDTGGISIKPGAGMEDMKLDMGGAAAVVGTMRALAGRKANTKVVAICGFAENMPSDRAYKPGDIIKTRAGFEVNIGNTDAEGRLVLCDAMDYIQDKYEPGTMLDTATLTGACVAALGHNLTGIMTPDKALWKDLKHAGEKSGQRGWRLPLGEEFSRAMRGKVSDLSNMANMCFAGASTAAAYLQNFVKKGTRWAHLDIAGTGIPANGISNGYGVRLFNRFVADHFENIESKKKAESTPKPEM